MTQMYDLGASSLPCRAHPLLKVTFCSSVLILQRVTVSISFGPLASGAKWGVDGTVICREKGCEGIECPINLSATSGSKGNVASLQTYKVSSLLYTNKSKYLIFTQLHVLYHPTHARSRDERILAEVTGILSFSLASTHFVYNRGPPNTVLSWCRHTSLKVPVVPLQDHHTYHNLRGFLHPMEPDKPTSRGSATVTSHSSS
jgi:hypothetical protein